MIVFGAFGAYGAWKRNRCCLFMHNFGNVMAFLAFLIIGSVAAGLSINAVNAVENDTYCNSTDSSL